MDTLKLLSTKINNANLTTIEQRFSQKGKVSTSKSIFTSEYHDGEFNLSVQPTPCNLNSKRLSQ